MGGCRVWTEWYLYLLQLTCSLKLNWKAGNQASTLWQNASKLALQRAYPKTSMHEDVVCRVKKTTSSLHEWMANMLHGKMFSTPQTLTKIQQQWDPNMFTRKRTHMVPVPLPSPLFSKFPPYQRCSSLDGVGTRSVLVVRQAAILACRRFFDSPAGPEW